MNLLRCFFGSVLLATKLTHLVTHKIELPGVFQRSGDTKETHLENIYYINLLLLFFFGPASY